MFIRFGFELTIDAQVRLPLILALSPHSSFGGRVLGTFRIRSEPDLPMEEFIDSFGNQRTRLVAPKGQLRLGRTA